MKSALPAHCARSRCKTTKGNGNNETSTYVHLFAVLCLRLCLGSANISVCRLARQQEGRRGSFFSPRLSTEKGDVNLLASVHI